MAEVSGISAVPEQQATQQTDPANTAATQSTGGGGISTMADLEKIAKPLADAIKFAIASNMCSASNRSNQRMKETLQEAQRRQGG